MGTTELCFSPTREAIARSQTHIARADITGGRMTGPDIARSCGGGVMEATAGISSGIGDPAAIGEVGYGGAIASTCCRGAPALPLLLLF